MIGLFALVATFSFSTRLAESKDPMGECQTFFLGKNLACNKINKTY